MKKKQRKSLPRLSLISVANRILAGNVSTKEERQGIIRLMDKVLEENECHRGFDYLTVADLTGAVPAEILPGIWPGDNYIDKFANTDPTRRKYL